MPIYEYKCEDCLKIFERLVHIHTDQKQKCPWCGKMVSKIMSTSNFHLDNTKGVGWGKDGYNRKGSVFTDREIKRPKLEPNKDHSKDKKPKIKVK